MIGAVQGSKYASENLKLTSKAKISQESIVKTKILWRQQVKHKFLTI